MMRAARDTVVFDIGGVLIDWNPRHLYRKLFAGDEVAAWPSMTILRGKIVVENGQFHAALSDGQFLPRKIPDEIRSRPAL